MKIIAYRIVLFTYVFFNMKICFLCTLEGKKYYFQKVGGYIFQSKILYNPLVIIYLDDKLCRQLQSAAWDSCCR